MQCKACQPCTELVLIYMYLGTTAMSVINMMVGVVGVCNLNYDDQIISLILRDLWFRTAVPVPSTSIVMDSILI